MDHTRLPSRASTSRLRAGIALAALLLGVAVAPATGRADAPGDCGGVDVDATVARVQTRYDGIRDFEARFEQTTRSVMMGGGGLGDESPTTGRVQLAKPGRMRWHYEGPRESLVLSDGETLWIHDVEAREVTRARVTEGYLAGAALQFLLGEGAIADEFSVSLLGCEGEGKGERIELELLPKQDASYEKLVLTVDAAGVVVGTTIHDLFGNVTVLRFEDVRFDQSPPAERFRFEPVEGVRVVDLDQPPGG